MKPLIISVHIPKTAGTTLEGIYQAVYGKRHFRIPNAGGGIDYIARSRQRLDWDTIDCVSGHMSYGLHGHIPDDRKPVYITFLRDPAERLLSLFYYIKRRPAHTQHKWTKPLGFMEWLETQRMADHDNGMLRFIAGRSDVGSNKQEGKVTKADYEQAIANLKGFAFVGFTESFNVDIVKLGEMLGWDVPQYQNKLVQKRKKADQHSKAVQDYLRQSQSWDYKLVEWTKENVK